MMKYIFKIVPAVGVHPAWLLYGTKNYAPTFDDEINKVANKLRKYGPETVKKIEQIIDVIGEDDLRKSNPVQKKKKGRRKTA